MDGIFISYRRDDSAGYAGRLYDRLAAHFGSARVFMDVEGIEPGVDFVAAIEEAVSSCRVLIVIIGDEWTQAVDAAGRRRLDDPADFIRIETATALQRGIRVVPVLVGGAVMPAADDLPPELKPLTRRQAIEINHKQWEASSGELIRVLERILAGAPASASVATSGSGPGTASPPAPAPIVAEAATVPSAGGGVTALAGRMRRFALPGFVAVLAGVALWFGFARHAGQDGMPPAPAAQPGEGSGGEGGAAAGAAARPQAPSPATAKVPSVAEPASEPAAAPASPPVASSPRSDVPAGRDTDAARQPDAPAEMRAAQPAAGGPANEPAKGAVKEAAKGPATDVARKPAALPGAKPAVATAAPVVPAAKPVVEAARRTTAKAEEKVAAAAPALPASKPEGGAARQALAKVDDKAAVPTAPPAGAGAVADEGRPLGGERWIYQSRGKWPTSPKRRFEIASQSIAGDLVTDALRVLEPDAGGGEVKRSAGGRPGFVEWTGIGTEFSPYWGAFVELSRGEGASGFTTPDVGGYWTNWHSVAKVLGEERVSVPAGAFNAYKVEIWSTRNATGGPAQAQLEPVGIHYLVWYAPAAKRYVKMQRRVISASNSENERDVFELVEHRLP